MLVDEFHRVVCKDDPSTGLQAVFALHDITLGPALGGIRRWNYPNVDAARADAMRLAHGMTYKNALAGIPFGGGKSVILAPPRQHGAPATPMTQAQLLRFGEWIEELGGEYVAAEDVGMRVADLLQMAERTGYVTGIGRNGRGGNPGPRTAQGVFEGIRVVAERLGGSPFALTGLHVAVQGLGNVGMSLCELLHGAGAKLVVADIDAAKVDDAQDRFDAQATCVDGVLMAEVDVVAPCALGGAISADIAATMPTRAVAGSANNQLACDEAAKTLKQRGIIYAPDYVINAGGVISAGLEFLGRDGFESEILKIGTRLARVFDEAEASGQSEAAVADAWAQSVVAQGGLERVA